MELNPNNPVTAAARDHWHKIAALMMIKLGITEVLITREDMLGVQALPEMPVVMLHDSAAGLSVKMISVAEAELLMERERAGGRSA